MMSIIGELFISGIFTVINVLQVREATTVDVGMSEWVNINSWNVKVNEIIFLINSAMHTW